MAMGDATAAQNTTHVSWYCSSLFIGVDANAMVWSNGIMSDNRSGNKQT